MNSPKRPDGHRGPADEEELDPDRIDSLLSRLEAKIDEMPSDNPGAQELRQEIETLRAMVESLDAEQRWSAGQQQSIRSALTKIGEMLGEDF
jgi:ribosome assembly protein YihI (activator of Der GTPase)